MRTKDLVNGILLTIVAIGSAGCHDTHDVALEEADVEVLFESLGTGREARAGDIVCIDYRVNTPANEELLWGKDFCFKLGAGATISGIDEAVPGMREGGRRTVKCPPQKHWGRQGYGGRIPPQTSLILDITLTAIQSGIE